MIAFYEKDHSYKSLDGEGNQNWISVTTLIKALHESFNPHEQAPKSSTRRPTSKYPNKWYGLPIEEILTAWNNEGERSTELGKWYHNLRENELCNRIGHAIYKPIIKDGIKIAPKQVLNDGIYPEHLVYLQSAGVCGQSDYVEVYNGRVIIKDYKTSKEIKRKGYENYLGVKKMLSPVSHLDDCHLSHYSLQLSIYMYCILRHNPSLLPGDMIIEHIKFVESGRDKYDYPIYAKNEFGDFIIKEIEEIKVPYLKSEVMSILKWLKDKHPETLDELDTE